jgi:UDP-2,4-diacetamido-2,4,6-trideoxy-beta-L-altropyranose hydrolase
MKKIIFRADGNSTTGLGHLYRIFALIEIYKTKYDHLLLTRNNSTVSVVPKHYRSAFIPNDVTIKEEPLWLSKHYPANEYMVIADGYQFDAAYQKELKECGYKLIYIDDQVKEKMYADVVINHALSVRSSQYKAEPYTRFALGTSYAILRPLFLEAAKKQRRISTVSKAFVCFGGADQFDLTLKATQALLNNAAIKKINVVIGAAYQHARIKELENKHGQLNVFQNLSERELLNVMEDSDLAIAPASTILYELCCVKMLILSGYYVDNQKNIYKGCLESGCIIDGGNFENYNVADFEDQINQVLAIKDPQPYIAAQAKVFDPQIKDRLLSLLSEIKYRKANASDMLLLYNWSNEKATRANSYHSEPIPLETHQKWFERKISDDKTLIYIAEVDNKPAGTVRYEIGEETTTVGIIVSEEYRGKGLAPVFLKDTLTLYFKEHHLPVVAYIKVENESSKRSFEKANYKFVKQELVLNAKSFVYKIEKKDVLK